MPKSIDREALKRIAVPTFVSQKPTRPVVVGPVDEQNPSLNYRSVVGRSLSDVWRVAHDLSHRSKPLSLPQLAQYRLTRPLSDEVWQSSITTLSEEIVTVDRQGIFANSGTPIVLINHGFSLMTVDDVINSNEISVGLEDSRIDTYLKEGKAPGVSKKDVIFLENSTEYQLRANYAHSVCLTLEDAVAKKAGVLDAFLFNSNPLVAARLGGYDRAQKYFEVAKHNETVFFGGFLQLRAERNDANLLRADLYGKNEGIGQEGMGVQRDFNIEMIARVERDL